MTARGRFIVFEGGEGCGKSTQSALLASSLGAVLTREPGGTAAGELIRRLLLDPSLPPVVPRAETLLMLAARAQHVEEVIEPALAAGRDVVCDRFSGSTVAYQGYGRGLDPGELARLSHWAAGGLEPDLVILLQVPPDVALDRRAARTEAGAGPDRFEGEVSAFFARIDDGFSRLAGEDPDRWRVVDGTGPVEAVAARVVEVVREALGR
ncbi:MAG TPA: dTMP kinase [Acidimicrobiales bacterium]|nr:dTMP kinase [Acidimicrobiales bacterium]